MIVHGDRHLPRVQRPHTHGHSSTRSLTHSSCLIHTYTRRGTHPRCFTHTWGFTHTCRFLHARGFSQLRCPFHTRRAGKHTRRHTRDHTTRTRGLTRTRGFTCTRGLSRGRTRGRFHTRGLWHTRGRTPTRGRFRTHPFTPGVCGVALRVHQCVKTRAATHTCRECKGAGKALCARGRECE